MKAIIYELLSFALVIGVCYLMLFHLDTAILWGCEKSIELRRFLGGD